MSRWSYLVAIKRHAGLSPSTSLNSGSVLTSAPSHPVGSPNPFARPLHNPYPTPNIEPSLLT
ncbi:hypothetical protein L484_018967 [Morus notabilis]|uniref:Uncharacterized protein n=1 Tax=Morus notabilis TaxID=981085 RepID=W9S8T4_9ROSA|nr:hypothetical protein L484_018967 [Morus notabilis]